MVAGGYPLRRDANWIVFGGASKIDVLEVFWPTTGKTQRFEDVGVDRRIEITEGQARYRQLSLVPISFQNASANREN